VTERDKRALSRLPPTVRTPPLKPSLRRKRFIVEPDAAEWFKEIVALENLSI
jgi:hypothetical protein